MIRLLIVDDSALMRRHLSQLFSQAGGFELEFARNGREAIECKRRFAPDVITLDINMPEMDGLTCLSMLMAERPCAVVMFSSLTEQGALATFEALALGAVDFFPKPGGTISLSLEQVGAELVAKVRAAAKAHLAPKAATQTEAKVLRKTPKPSTPVGQKIVLVGASTGGPRVLEEIIQSLPADFPYPIVIAQHMPASFTKAFAQRLDRSSALSVVEVSRPEVLHAGKVYVGMGGADVLVSVRAGVRYVIPKPENQHYLWHPSVSLLVSSALEQLPAQQLIGVMLTGMGYDGAAEMTELKRLGGYTIAEAKETSVVFGMPAELIRRGGASEVVPSFAVATTLMHLAGAGSDVFNESASCH